MKLLLIRDRRVGHAHHVEGMALAIERLAPVETDRIELRRRWYLFGKGYQTLLKHLAPRDALRRIFDISLEGRPVPDVVLASGRHCFDAAVLIRRVTGARLIYSGYKLRYPPDQYDLMLVSSPRFAFEPKCAMSPIPCIVDSEKLPKPRPLLDPQDLRGASFSMLLGGVAKGYHYKGPDWRSLAALVEETGAEHGIRWSVSTSRRTPREAVDVFGALAARGKLARFIDFRVAGPGSASDFYAADAVVVTEDSRGMIAESIASGRPTIIIRPPEATFSELTEDVVAIAMSGGAAILSAENLTGDRFLRALFSVRPARHNLQATLADLMAPALGFPAPVQVPRETADSR